MAKGCKICHATTPELDSTGRCLGCALVLEAQTRKLSYGNLMALKRRPEPVMICEEDLQELEEQPDDGKWHRCAWCGKLFQGRNSAQRFCSKDCYSFQHRIDERNALRKKKGQVGPRFCAICGKEIPVDRRWNSKTCGDKCKDIFLERQYQERYGRKKTRKAAENG